MTSGICAAISRTALAFLTAWLFHAHKTEVLVVEDRCTLGLVSIFRAIFFDHCLH